MRQLRGALVAGWLLVACGPTHQTTDDPSAGGRANDAGAPSSGGAASGGSEPASAGTVNGGVPGAGGKANDAGAPGNAEAGQGGFDVPVPPPAQGATTFSISAVSPSPAGKECPVGAALTDFIPNAPNDPFGVLDADTYQHKIIDGEDAAVFKCKVVGTSTFTFQAEIRQGGHALVIEAGVLSAQHQGSAKVTLTDSTAFAGTLASSAACVVDAKPAAGNNFQVKAGSMWASFSCTTVEAAPSNLCKASGFFVLENCEQE